MNADEVLAEDMPQLPGHQRALVRKFVQVVLEALPDALWARKWGQLTFTCDEN